jgi:hypothetical protein
MMGASRRVALCLLAGLLGAGCEPDAGERAAEGPAPSVDASEVASAAAPKPGQFVQPPRPAFDPNPLKLPGAAPTLAADSLVYTVPRHVLETARAGSSFVLHAATAEGVEGGNVIVHIGHDASYPVHPAYVLVPPHGTLRRGAAVLAPNRGQLGHAVVVAVKRDLVTVHYTDLGPGYGDQPLPARDVAPQGSGLAPGNYAVVADGEVMRQVLLLSGGTHADGKRRWLALGYAGEASLIEEERLQPVPLDFQPKVGAVVAVPWLGTMVPGRVTAVDPRGIYTVRRARVVPPLFLGPGMLMPAGK